jgi:hypothetical protein
VARASLDLISTVIVAAARVLERVSRSAPLQETCRTLTSLLAASPARNG